MVKTEEDTLVKNSTKKVKKKKRKNPIINHHIIYENDAHRQKELTVPIRSNIHWTITQLMFRH